MSSVAKAKSIRDLRDQFLLKTDYLALSDGTLTPAMATYRQELRDIPAQAGFPDTITWPQEPTT